MNNVINTVRQTINKYSMFQNGDKIVVGVSGGPDSVCLLHVLNLLKDEYQIKLYAAHLNHQLRGQAAEQDAAYVKELCEKLQVPVYIKSVDIRQLSKERAISEEVAGREERYAFFFKIARQVGARKIAVAQNMNDQAETVLMRFIRGTGLEGLSGIKPVREDGVVRPLLETGREAIEQYCQENGLNPRLDETNLKSIYTRNKIRLDLIPYIIKEHNSGFIQTAAKTAELIREDNDFIKDFVNNMIEKQLRADSKGIYIPVTFLLNQHLAIQRRVIRKAIDILKGNTANIEYKHIEEIVQMVNGKNTGKNIGKALDLPEGLRMEIVYNDVYLFRKGDSDKKNNSFYYPLKLDQQIFIKEINMTVTAYVSAKENLKNIELNDFTKAFDYNVINEEIYIRNRLPGDKFTPLGMDGTKKLKDFFIDLKVPRNKRDKVPIVATDKDILWVVGYRINDKYKCTNKTADVLIIQFSGGDTNVE
ncbi:tRNA lysidine(34) synthetase TilS [Petroclostridium xylanilyticum]|uniref:tRNA lysidine(34) synthetase TilS n=1 Tax=Petroclostridium xylanilyticum TaxID=1792311 RepID=UPI000B9869AD|nr:tRNA lysidine(34) synthetase TilS [Petroclostridium xylanilyticum]